MLTDFLHWKWKCERSYFNNKEEVPDKISVTVLPPHETLMSLCLRNLLMEESFIARDLIPPRFEHRTVLVKGLGCDPDSANGGAKGMGRGRGRGGSSGKIG
ncbi:hypothetical protein POTOM_038940 [Populus tomentosa]|uniref:Uncharacterized protein n=1 Tax=Populus tomentosa TaxID=118781 RepID=A0A8X7YXQ7_POPTO|nr:hypothetical protein POTOM_038940 [Populus tomentosa]